MARIIAIITLIISLTLVPFAIQSNSAPAQAAPVVSCTDTVHPTTVEVICSAAGITLLDVQVPRPSVLVTLPPVRITATATVHVTGPAIPGPTRTATVTVPGPTTIIGPNAVVTRTTTVQPGKQQTAMATAKATATSTTTQTVKPVGHPHSPHATLEPPNKPGVFPQITFSGPVQKAAVGLGILIFAGLLGILATLLGYYLGYKDSEKNETRFLKSLLRRN